MRNLTTCKFGEIEIFCIVCSPLYNVPALREGPFSAFQDLQGPNEGSGVVSNGRDDTVQACARHC